MAELDISSICEVRVYTILESNNKIARHKMFKIYKEYIKYVLQRYARQKIVYPVKRYGQTKTIQISNSLAYTLEKYSKTLNNSVKKLTWFSFNFSLLLFDLFMLHIHLILFVCVQQNTLI